MAEALGFTLAVAIYIWFLRAQWYCSIVALVALVLASFIWHSETLDSRGPDCWRVRGCNRGMAVVARVQHCSGGNPRLDAGDPGTPGLPMVRLFVSVYYHMATRNAFSLPSLACSNVIVLRSVVSIAKEVPSRMFE